MSNSIFGFSTAPSGGGDFLPVCKYDSRAGRFFRNDRKDTGGVFVTEPVDITAKFKAVVDLENIEVGWISFATGGAPDFRLVPMGQPVGPKPGPDYKNGVRLMIKLSKEVGGEKPIRELASNARSFVAGLEQLYMAYQDGAKANAGKLPIVELETTMPVKSGPVGQQSTNYQPVFKIVGWAARGDLVFQPRNGNSTAGATQPKATAPAPATPPSTGSTRVDPPAAPAAVASTEGEDDFG